MRQFARRFRLSRRQQEVLVLPWLRGGRMAGAGASQAVDRILHKLYLRDGAVGGIWESYRPEEAYDELFEGPGAARASARSVSEALSRLSLEDIRARQDAAELTIRVTGITFTVYSEGENIDRAWPFDLFPRVLPESEWRVLERGLEQRLTALNAFVSDVYGEQRIFGDGVVPRELLASSKNFREQCAGATPRFGVWANICGTDLVRDRDGKFYVLEDNLRVPSGVSYMLENRMLTKRVFPELFARQQILPIDDYPSRLFDTLAALSPRPGELPNIVVLTPGIYNSAYFEHAFLAQRMGVELVEGSDLVVSDDDCVYMRTIDGLERVDVVYRRIDDLFLDPEVFEEDSLIGVPGLMRAWRSGKVGLANAPGVGVADDKVVYAYVPRMIQYYLGEDAIIPNVPTYVCSDEKDRRHVLANLAELVIKPANESGGYGIVLGPRASARELEECAARIEADPRNFVAQPLVMLSTAPTLCGDAVEPRHLDLRPFILQAERTHIPPGGLTRVALPRGSFVVNSSQGGGSKDTWVVGEKA